MFRSIPLCVVKVNMGDKHTSLYNMISHMDLLMFRINFELLPAMPFLFQTLSDYVNGMDIPF